MGFKRMNLRWTLGERSIISMPAFFNIVGESDTSDNDRLHLLQNQNH